jgi:hypothetical protein
MDDRMARFYDGPWYWPVVFFFVSIASLAIGFLLN